MKSLSTLHRLRIAHLLFGMMFWYGIEQLFLNKYLHTGSARGYLTAAFIASLLVFDIPGGVLADKFGRKRALLLACGAQTVGLIIFGSSNSLGQYMVGSIVFGVFVSLLNGAAQALLYDHLQLNKITASYGKQQGSIYAMFLIGAGIANLASGFIAHKFGLRMPYFLSIVPSILAFLVLLPIVEPPLGKSAAKWYAHLGEVVAEIRAHPRIVIFGIQFIVSQLIMLTIGEFGQIYILSFHVGAIALGILWAIDAAFAALGRVWAHRMHAKPNITVVLYCVVLLVFVSIHWWLGIFFYWLAYGYNQSLANIAETEVQDETKSSIRATLFSTVSFCSNIVGIPVVLVFNKLYVHHSIFTANTAIVVVAICVLIPSVFIVKGLAPKPIPLET